MRIFVQIGLYITLTLCLNNCLYAQVTDFENIDFTKADHIARLHKGASLDNLPLLTYQLTHTLPTPVEKFRAIYRWVCTNIKGDHAQHNTILHKRKKFKNDSVAFMNWNKEYKKKVFKKLLKHKKTMCTGYAYLIKELCYLANIESLIIDGYGRSVNSNIKKLEMANHSWNAVKLNNKWYLCDATWSSGYTDENNIFIQEYNNGYFLTPPILFGKNHFPLEQKWVLHKKVTTETFVNAPLLYGKAFKYKIEPLNPQKLETTIYKNDEVTFSFKMVKKTTNNNIRLVCFTNNKEQILNIDTIQNENGSISFKYQFKQKGIYDTHLKINNEIVATYTFKVIKNKNTSRP